MVEQRAITLIQQGNLEEAEEIYRSLIKTGGARSQTYTNLAFICGAAGRWEEVIDLCKAAINVAPDSSEAYNNLGAAQLRTGQSTQALSSFQKATELNPNDTNTKINIAILQKENGSIHDAVGTLRDALRIKPDDPDILRSLGTYLREAGDIDNAIHYLEESLRLAPQAAVTHGELGICHYEKDNLSKAVNHYLQFLRAHPRSAAFHSNLAVALVDSGKIQEAIKHFETAIALEPNNPEHHYSSSMAYLYVSDHFEIGWEKYEWRSKRLRDPIRPDAQPNSTPWEGQTLDRRTNLLVVSEQGFGDTIQMMRYVPYLRERCGANISVCAPAKLHALIQATGVDPEPLSPEEGRHSKPDHWVSMMTLPGLLGVRPEQPICSDPYIKAPIELINQWKRRLEHESRPIIGIHWQGNPDHENTVTRGRSFRLETFRPVADLRVGSLLSLQKGFGSEQLAECSFRDQFVRCQAQINETWDFLETAAIIANCDLVITSDSAIAHLAGGSGKPTWLLLKKVPEWRWGLESDTTFWYPAMRLFRQQERGNWDDVMRRVATEINQGWGSSSSPVQAAPTHASTPGQQNAFRIQAPISLGELLEKITNLQLESQHLQGAARQSAQEELVHLQAIFNRLQLSIDTALIQSLKDVNHNLSQAQHALREREGKKRFDEIFIQLARSANRLHHERLTILDQINSLHSPPLQANNS